MRNHERIEELVALRALGALEAADHAALEAALAEHGPECADCRRLTAEYEETAARLAFSLDPVPLRRGMADEILAAPREPVGHPSERASVRAIERPRSLRRWQRVLAAAAALVLFGGGWVLGSLTSGGPSEEAEGLVRALSEGASVVRFEGARGDLAIAYRPGRSGVYVLGANLPTPPEGRAYELWMIQGEEVLPGPCLRPEADGRLLAFVDAELGTTDAMAVTVEPDACPAVSTGGDPLFTADLSAV